jgi:hypothetical protein
VRGRFIFIKDLLQLLDVPTEFDIEPLNTPTILKELISG